LLLAALAIAAQALDLQTVEAGSKTVVEADLVLAVVKVGIVELDDAAAAGAHHVVMPLARSHPLVDIVLAAEAGLAGEATLDEEVQRSVDGGAGDALSLVAQLEEERVGVEVAGGVEELLEEHEALLGHLLVVVAKKLDEEFLGSLHVDLPTAAAT
jgi:hypothetical protein